MGNAVARVNGDAYTILGTLGEGGFATVYEVLRRRDKRHLALKWVRGVRDSAQLARLEQEIRVHRSVAHAHVLPLVDAEVRECSTHGSASDAGGVSYVSNHSNNSSSHTTHAGAQEVLMLFPICAHGSLHTLLQDAFQKDVSPFSESECLRFFAALLTAVQELHDRGFAHRDVRPGTILLSSANPVTPVLTGFHALAPLRCLVQTTAEHHAVCDDAAAYSAAAYRPPELWTGHTLPPNAVIDGRTDVWQLGCTLYAMAFGPLSPFEYANDSVGQRRAIQNGTVRFPPHKIATSPPSCLGDERFSPTFTAFVKWLLVPDSASRPTLADVRDQLQQLRSGVSVSTWSVSSSTTSPSLRLSIGDSDSDTMEPECVLLPLAPATQVLSFSKLASAEWASFAACEKQSRPASPVALLSVGDSSEDWGEFAAFERSSSTSALSTNTVVWSTDSATPAVALATPCGEEKDGDGRQRRQQQCSRRHSIGATVAPPLRQQGAASLLTTSRRRELELRRALSTRGRLLLTEALDSRTSP